MNPKLIRTIVYISVSLAVFSIVCLTIINIYKENLRDLFLIKNTAQAGLIDSEVLSFSIEEITASQIPQNLKPIRDWSSEDLKVPSKAAICIETNLLDNNKVLFKKNESERLPIASLTKLMAALVVLENYDLEQTIMISEEAVNQLGEQGLFTAGEAFPAKNLLYVMLIESSNDAAYALAEIEGIQRFVDLMNLKAIKLGLLDSSFVDPTGLSSDNYSTAEDLVKLTKYLLENHPLVWEILSNQSYKLFTSQKEFHHDLVNTNELLGKIPEIIGGKTGSTLEAKGCLLLILKNQNNQSNLIYIILGSDDRFGEMQQLIDWVSRAYKW